MKSWYEGECLIELLDKINVPNRTQNKPVRLSVLEYYQRNQGVLIGDCIQAKVESGIVNEKDTLMMMP